jgi:riboflavin synthase
MFTGLTQDIGQIRTIEHKGGGVVLTIATRMDLSAAKIGDSIAVDGICLTITKRSAKTFSVDVSPETLKRTTLEKAREGQPVNLETALRLSDPLGGHFVAGHIDGTGVIAGIAPEGNSLRYRFRVSPAISRYLVEKGSVAVDGVSLTVADSRGREFSVSVIPHTLQATTLGRKKVGDAVNLENDLIAKYVEKFARPKGDSGSADSGLDAAFLAENGFIR